MARQSTAKWSSNSNRSGCEMSRNAIYLGLATGVVVVALVVIISRWASTSGGVTVASDPVGAFYQANGHLEMDQYPEAIRLYASVAEPSGHDPVVLANWASALMGKRTLESESTGDGPLFSPYELCMRDSTEPGDLLGDAERCARRAFEASDSQPDVTLVLCAVLEARALQEEALQLLRTAHEANPDHAGVLYCLIRAIDRGGDTSPSAINETMVLQERLLALRPGNVAALLDAALTPAHAAARIATFKKRLDMLLPTTLVMTIYGPLAMQQATLLERVGPLARRIEAVIVEVRGQFADRINLSGIADAASAGDAITVKRSLVFLANVMRGADRFRSDIVALGRTGDEVPLPITHPLTDLGEEPAAAIRATLAFESVPLPGPDGVFPVRISLGCVTADRQPALYATYSDRSGVLWVYGNDQFADTTQQMGLEDAPSAHNAIFADADNDRLQDLLLLTPLGPRLYRQAEGPTFTDVTRASGLAEAGDLRGAVPFDYDHDGDIDLLVWTATSLHVLPNDGEGRFGTAVEHSAFAVDNPGHRLVDVEPFDLDDDGDIDLATTWMTESGYELGLIANERMVNFRRVDLGSQAAFRARPTFVDSDNDGRLDVLDVSTGRCLAFGDDLQPRVVTSSGFAAVPDAFCGVAGDLDNSGAVEVVTVAADGASSLPGITLADVDRAVRPIIVDLDRDGRLDVLSHRGELWYNRSTGTGNWLNISLVGVVKGDTKFNTFGLGSTVELRAGTWYQKQYATSPWTHFGLGPYGHADVLRILWPNGNYQHIEHRTFDRMALKANHVVVEEQSLKGSCPYLYAWDGERFEFVTDVLWRSALGMSVGMGQLGHHGSADDYFKIKGAQLRPDADGHYVLQFTSELQEIAYFDYTRLMVVDHPAELDIVVDEKCQAPPYPPFEIFPVREPRAVQAIDHHGHDATELLARPDGRTIRDFELTRYQGVVEPHDLILDLGSFAPSEPVRLFLSGWVWPTDASINVAIGQNPTTSFVPPQLSVAGGDGTWQPVDLFVGFPSGKNKTIVLDLTGRWPSADHRIKLSTTMAIFWDHVWSTVGAQPGEVVTTVLPVATADLHERGFSLAFPRVPHGPVIPQYDAPDRWRVWREATGLFTRCGDVTGLLTARDSRTIILGAGDEVTLRFDSSSVPRLPAGWRRDYVIHTDGWLKDGDLNTATGSTVEPLPYVGMSSYPYDGENPLRADPAYRSYLEQYNTRRRINAPLRRQLRPEE